MTEQQIIKLLKSGVVLGSVFKNNKHYYYQSDVLIAVFYEDIIL